MYVRRIASVIVTKLVILALMTALLVGCGGDSSSESASENNLPQDSIIIELTGVDSSSVFELTRDSHIVVYESHSMGVFVKAIDGNVNGGEHFWVCSVNDSMLNVASDKYTTRSGDVIKWHFRRMTR